MKQRESGIIKTSIIGIIGNVLLVVAKAIIGFVANSVSLITDAVNNLTDSLSSIITIIGTKLSNKKPDRKHPYGHGRIEYITATLIGLIILVAGGIAIYESIISIIDYFQNGTQASYEDWALILIAAGIVVKLGLGLFFRIRGKKFKSDVLKASGIDALFDALLSFGTLVGAILSKFWGIYAEGYIGIVIGLFILKSGISVILESISHIIGLRVDEKVTKEIKSEIQAVEGVEGVYDLILNNYGNEKYIGSVHIGVKADLTAKEIQAIEREIQGVMYLNHNIIMTVGIYAHDEDTNFTREVKNSIHELIKDNKHILQIHGFYVDYRINLITFDLVIDFDEENPKGFVKHVEEALKEKYPEYNFLVNIDYDY